MKCQNSIFSFLDLLNSDYKKKDNWMNLLNNIEIEDDIKPFVQYLESELIKNSNNELIYDIIDFIVDFCSENIVKLICEDWFLNSFLSSLKKGTGISLQIQMKIIFLIQKWSLKYSYDYPNFRYKHEFLKNNGIIFPDSHFEMKTYDKYFDKNSFIKDYKSQNANEFTFNIFNQQNDSINDKNENIQIENKQNSYMNNNFNRNISLYGNPYSFDINDNYNSNKNINNKNKIIYPNYPINELLEESIDNFEVIKQKYIEKINICNNYINEGKNSLNDEKLQQTIQELIDDLSKMESLIENYSNNHQFINDFINIRNDIEQTLFRYDNFKNGNQIEPFISSFDDNNKRYKINKSNYFDNKDEKKSKIKVIKKGLYNFGNILKEKGMNGFDYIKGKISKDKQNSSFEDTYYNHPSQNNCNTYGTYRVNDDNFYQSENKGILNSVKGGLSKVGNKISNVFKKSNN